MLVKSAEAQPIIYVELKSYTKAIGDEPCYFESQSSDVGGRLPHHDNKCRESSAESGVIFVTLSWFKLRRPSTDASLILRNKAPNTAWRDKGITPRSACCRWNGIQEGGLAVSNRQEDNLKKLF
ncbi:hypothetical protein TNCV_2264571 [Trichonephila clavipes]|nr:hypothetical protein TNCV_2264571 [Trichonephila clavipes]